jgi:hypothetical protein
LYCGLISWISKRWNLVRAAVILQKEIREGRGSSAMVQAGSRMSLTTHPQVSSKTSLCIICCRKFVNLDNFSSSNNGIFSVKINPLNTKCRLLYLKKQSVPCSKLFHLCYKNQSVYDISGTIRRTKHINTVWAQRTIF